MYPSSIDFQIPLAKESSQYIGFLISRGSFHLCRPRPRTFFIFLYLSAGIRLLANLHRSQVLSCLEYVILAFQDLESLFKLLTEILTWFRRQKYISYHCVWCEVAEFHVAYLNPRRSPEDRGNSRLSPTTYSEC